MRNEIVQTMASGGRQQSGETADEFSKTDSGLRQRQTRGENRVNHDLPKILSVL